MAWGRQIGNTEVIFSLANVDNAISTRDDPHTAKHQLGKELYF